MEPIYNYLLIAIAFFSILSNILVVVDFRSHFETLSAPTTRLIIFLHISCLLQNLCSVPYIYTGNTVLCELMGFFHYYFGLINVFSIVYLTIFYYFTLTRDGDTSRTARDVVNWMSSYGLILPFVFGFIALFPFMDNSYGKVDIWCSLTVSEASANDWAFIIFYLWVLLATTFCSSMFLYLYSYYSKLELQCTERLCSLLGIYILISICCFIPRLAYRIVGLIEPEYEAPDIFSFLAGVPMYIAGLLYCVNYYYSNDDMTKYERVFHLSVAEPNPELTSSLLNEFQTSLSDTEPLTRRSDS
eukprot:gene16817-19187_t